MAHCTFIGIINLRAAPVTHELNGQFDNTDILEYFVVRLLESGHWLV